MVIAVTRAWICCHIVVTVVTLQKYNRLVINISLFFYPFIVRAFDY